jgi:SAM-dependent methyltransferase
MNIEPALQAAFPAALEDNATYGKFGEYYDAIYADRDYAKDVKLVERLLHGFARQRGLRILELGCGTGGHTLPLARMGHEIVGVDRSPAMLAAARRKAAAAPGLKLTFQQTDIRALAFRDEFDACVGMFGCMSYLIASEDLRKTLQGVARALVPQGLFIFDFWNEAAVTIQKPSVRRKDVVLSAQQHLVRMATPEVDWRAKTCSIRYQVSLLENQAVKESFEETHQVRFFSQKEMTAELEGAGFELLDIFTPDGGKTGLDDSWFLAAVARRKRDSGRP